MFPQKLLFIFGTRPEAIKMAPLIIYFKNKSKNFNVEVCVTAQHREMLDEVLSFFEITPNYDLNIMTPGQSLFQITAKALISLEEVINKAEPDIIFVQGDTTTAFVGGLSGYYKRIKIAHLEAGLRSGDIYSPFPEEVNRKLISQFCHFHFTPTINASENLKKEGFIENIHQVGNSVIDALHLGLSIIKSDEKKYQDYFQFIDFNKKIILVTSHRRESFGEPFKNICKALSYIHDKYPDSELIYPVHPNPEVKKAATNLLGNKNRIHLIEPLAYPYLIWLMNKSYFIISDSGGIQEEGPALGKPVLVIRDVTERTEGIDAGTAKLVGTNTDKIVTEAAHLLENKNAYQAMSKAVNPYGNGTTSEQIGKILTSYFNSKNA